MILHKGAHPSGNEYPHSLRVTVEKYDLVDCMIDWKRCTTIHGDDVLAHSNWEVGEAFFRKYPYVIPAISTTLSLTLDSFLAEANTLAVSNRWRKERGEQELRISDYEHA